MTPYKGLAAFGDSDLDALLFFGRGREIEVIVANLIASRLTVLYGATGVGKSSILRAGVAHRLRQDPDVEVIVWSTWTGDSGAPVREARVRSRVRDPEVEQRRGGDHVEVPCGPDGRHVGSLSTAVNVAVTAS